MSSSLCVLGYVLSAVSVVAHYEPKHRSDDNFRCCGYGKNVKEPRTAANSPGK